MAHELCSILRASLNGRGVWGRTDTCVSMAESLHCSPELITTLLISSTPIQNVFGHKLFIFLKNLSNLLLLLLLFLHTSLNLTVPSNAVCHFLRLNLQFFFFLFFKFFVYFLTLQCCIGFAIYQHESATGIHVPHPEPSSTLPPRTIPLGRLSAPASSIQ